MRLSLHFTLFCCMTGHAFAAADAICRDTHLAFHGSVVGGVPSAAYLVAQDCPEAPLRPQPRFPRLAIRWSPVEGARPVMPAIENTAVAATPAPATAEIGRAAPVTVLFDLNSYELTRTANDLLHEVPAGREVSVAGYACELGAVAQNLELSQRRAETVAAYLRTRGVLVRSVEGQGECCPVSDQLNLNRRVEITPILEKE